MVIKIKTEHKTFVLEILFCFWSATYIKGVNNIFRSGNGDMYHIFIEFRGVKRNALQFCSVQLYTNKRF